MEKIKLRMLVASLSLLSMSASAQWFMTGSSIRDVNKDYRTQYDDKVYIEGESSLLLESKRNTPTGFATVMQTLKLDKKYRGERVMLTVSLRSENVKKWAGAWLRVNKIGKVYGAGISRKGKLTNNMTTLAFDNMQDRPLKGSLEWKKYYLVLDVGDRAGSLSYGLILQGAGKVWMDDVSLDVVDESVPLTGSMKKKSN